MTNEVSDEDHPARRWLDSTFGSTGQPAIAALPRSVLEEQLFIVLKVAVRPANLPAPVLDQLACAGAAILRDTAPEQAMGQLRRLLAALPLSPDRLLHVLIVMQRLNEAPPDRCY